MICCKWSKPAGFSSISYRQPNKLQLLTFFALVTVSWSLALFSPTQLWPLMSLTSTQKASWSQCPRGFSRGNALILLRSCYSLSCSWFLSCLTFCVFIRRLLSSVLCKLVHWHSYRHHCGWWTAKHHYAKPQCYINIIDNLLRPLLLANYQLHNFQVNFLD